jgi:hypothetical protein
MQCFHVVLNRNPYCIPLNIHPNGAIKNHQREEARKRNYVFQREATSASFTFSGLILNDNEENYRAMNSLAMRVYLILCKRSFGRTLPP